MIDFNKQIPKREFPNIKEFIIKENDEEIIDLKGLSNKFIISPAYFQQGIPGAPKSCYLRKTPAQLLVIAASQLPKGYYFKLFDGWRPYAVQKRLWDYYYQDIKQKNPGLSKEELEFKTSFFVSKPTQDINRPFLHNTGGAIDLTICDEKGKELDMGIKFDAFGKEAWTVYYEEHCNDPKSINIRNNRRLLYNIMTSVGFTNLPSEWWHYDYGTKFWGYFNGVPALYKGKLYLDNIESL